MSDADLATIRLRRHFYRILGNFAGNKPACVGEITLGAKCRLISRLNGDLQDELSQKEHHDSHLD